MFHRECIRTKLTVLVTVGCPAQILLQKVIMHDLIRAGGQREWAGNSAASEAVNQSPDPSPGLRQCSAVMLFTVHITEHIFQQ